MIGVAVVIHTEPGGPPCIKIIDAVSRHQRLRWLPLGVL